MREDDKNRRIRNRADAVRKQRLILAAVCACLLLVIIAAASARSKKKASDVQDGGQQEDVSESADSTTALSTAGGKIRETADKLNTPNVSAENLEERTITVTATGDCTFGNDETFEYGGSFDDVYESEGDISYFFGGVKEVFEEDDLTIVNFEGTLTESDTREDKQYAFKGRPGYVNILSGASVEAANLANNHTFDYGKDAYEDTKKNLADAGIVSFGYDRSQVIEVNGIKVGLIGIMEIFKDLEAKDDVDREIPAVKEQGAELIIVTFHWGNELDIYPTETQETLAHYAIDNGADLVIGHHSHRLNGIEKYKGKYICYSLGNFCFGGNKHPSDMDTMIFRQTFTLKDGETADDGNIEIIPCMISSSYDYNDYRPTLLYGEEAERVAEKVLERSEGWPGSVSKDDFRIIEE